MKPKGKSNRDKSPAPSLGRLAIPIAIIAMLAIALVGSIVWYRSDSHAESIARGDSASADPGTPITLDPNEFAGEAHDAFQIARQQPRLLVQLHCYCGCDKTLGHKSLLDCYRDRHAAGCPICIGEAKDASQMEKRGESIDEIRDALRARYEHAE
jgi:Protein of unknown function with PCYCGC motif